MTPRPRFMPPRQARSRKTLDRILDAAEGLIAEQGVADTTLQQVLGRAGVSMGSFYARFDGRDALVHHLQNRFWEQAEAQWRTFLAPERWQSAPAAVLVGELVRILIRGHALRAAALRSFLLHALSNPDDKALTRVAVLDEAVARRLVELLGPGGEVRHPDPATAIPIATRQLLSTLRGAVLFGNGSLALPAASDEEAILELSRSFLGYLDVADPPTSYDELRRRVADYRRERVGAGA